MSRVVSMQPLPSFQPQMESPITHIRCSHIAIKEVCSDCVCVCVGVPFLAASNCWANETTIAFFQIGLSYTPAVSCVGSMDRAASNCCPMKAFLRKGSSSTRASLRVPTVCVWVVSPSFPASNCWLTNPSRLCRPYGNSLQILPQIVTNYGAAPRT